MRQWYCVRTKPKKESAAELWFRGQLDLEVYYPRLRRRKTIRRAQRWVVGPLFPRYLFCRFDLSEHYRTVRYAREVIGIVSFGDRPAVVEPAVIDQLKEWAGEAVDVMTLHPNPKPGDTVEITDGAFCGLKAVVERDMSDQQRVTLLLTALASRARVVISRDQIQPAS
jgi:transcriptional antiterminator RfaH